MKLSTCSIVLAVFAVAIAAPDYYGSKSKKIIPTTTLEAVTLPADVPKDVEFDCSDKEDGGYVVGCSQDYWLCWKHVATKASCPEGMMFNSENGGCDFNINIFECTGVHTSPLPAEVTTTLKPVDFDCSKLSDGDYPFSTECQLTYVSCVGGKGLERTCPDNLSFDPEKRMCERLENIEACGGAPTTALPELEIKFDCPSPDGSFALPAQLCSAVYFLCKDNVASIAICDEPMLWDDKNKICALPKDIPDCSFDCTGKADAAYSEGCSKYYWWCWQEKATKLECPEGMMFDAERGLCDFHDNVFECTGEHPTTLPPAEPTSTLKPVDFDCSNLEDGNHAYKNGEKCQPKFVSCVGGFAWEMVCPDGLLFDPDQLLCEHIENIVACGGTAEPMTTTVLADEPKYTRKPLIKIPTTLAPIKTTVVRDFPKDNYGSYETTTVLADEPITTTRRSYLHRTTPLADVPTTKSYGYKKMTTKLADIPTTKSYGHKMTTKLADIPTTKAYGIKKTTILADLPETTTLAYNSDDYGASILLDTPTTVHHRRMHLKTTEAPKTTILADEPLTDDYNNFETTTLADIPTTESYGHYETTTLLDLPTTTRRVYHRTTTLADIPTTKSYGGYSKKMTTLADIPTTKSYGYKKMTTTLADIPTTKSYGYKKMTTTLADIPTTESYGNYETTTLADIPTTKSYGYKKMTTTLADIPTTKSYGYKKTTTLADIPTTESYGNYETTIADVPVITTRRPIVHRTTTLADIPTTKSYGSYETTPLADEPLTTVRRRSFTRVTPAPELPKDDY